LFGSLTQLLAWPPAAGWPVLGWLEAGWLVPPPTVLPADWLGVPTLVVAAALP
jgi:hypothetical protein